MTERRRVYFTGRVQGVGFRYTAVAIARGHAVTGYVENLKDGRVVVLAEGDAAELDRYLAELGAAMKGYIRDSDIETAPPTGEFADFEVRF